MYSDYSLSHCTGPKFDRGNILMRVTWKYGPLTQQNRNSLVP